MKTAELQQFLSKSPLFSLLDEALLDQLVDRFEMASYELGETVVRQGEPADSIFLILSGKARAVGTAGDGSEITLATLGRGDLFGERALLTSEARSATIRAASELIVARLAKEDFTAVVKTDEAVHKFLRDYLSHQALFNFLRQFTVFSALTAKEVTQWLSELQHEQVPAGRYVFKEGDPPDKFYIIVSGKAEVLRRMNGDEKLVNTLRDGQFFGELALLTNKPRLASIRAKEDLSVVTLSKDRFERLVMKSDKLKEKFQNVIALYNLDAVIDDLPFAVKTKAEVPPAAPEDGRVVAPPLEAEDGRGRPSAAPRRGLAALRQRAPRRFRYPFIEQYDQTDCAAASLAMVCKYYGKRLSVTRLRDMANVSTEGASLISVARAAEALGLNARAVKATYDNMLRLTLPAIVHWDGYHYIVLWELTPTRAVVSDPGRGLLTYERKEFSERWTGFALILEPTVRFGEVESAKTSLVRFVRYVLPYRWLLLEVLACSLLISTFGLATPIFTQLIVDNVVVHQNVTLLNTVLAGMLLLTVFSIATTALRTYLMSHLTNKISLAMLSDFYRQVLSVPIRYFELRRVGDILSRFEENEKIKELLTSTTLSLFIDVLMIIVYLTVMFFYSPKLSFIVLIFVPLYVALTTGFTPAFKRMSRKAFEREAATESLMVESITGVKTLKASNAELYNRWKYEGLLAATLKTRFSFMMVGLTESSISGFLHTLSTVVLLYFGATLVINGELTIGQLMAFSGLVGHVIEPINKLAEQWNHIQESLIAVERLNDVFDVKPEEERGDTGLIELPRVRGHIKFENVSFAYSKSDRMILRNLSFEVLPGQTVAIVGRSGSGKTTLMNLLQRFYAPSEGRITIDGIDIQNVTVSSLRRQIGVVLQENYLFSGTIRDNIALGAPEKPFNAIVEAATLAAAHDFISELPLGYKSDVGERGSSLSGGQRQRIAIARALVSDPRILVFDEATSALDNESEKAIQKSLAAITRDRTTFVIAHRLTTVQNADQIIVLDQGVIVEQGTHHELMDKHGLYYYLNSMSLDLA